MPTRSTKQPAPAGDAPATDDLEALDFETAVLELETLVEQMEGGDLSLEASLAAYERGVRLTRHCQSALRRAELKVNKLTEDGQLEPLDPDSLDED